MLLPNTRGYPIRPPTQTRRPPPPPPKQTYFTITVAVHKALCREGTVENGN